MKKRMGVLFLIVLLILPISLASIEIISEPKNTYNIGDQINIQGITIPEKNFLGKLKLSLICGPDSTDMLLKVFSFEKDQTISFNENLYIFPTSSNICKIKASIEEQDIIIEHISTKSFTIDPNLNTIINLSKKTIQLGEELIISGETHTATEQNIDGSSTLTLKKEGETIQVFSTPIIESKFQYKITPVFLEEGTYIIEVNTQDSFGNKKTVQEEIKILATVNLTANIKQNIINPGEEINIEGKINYQTQPQEKINKVTIKLGNLKEVIDATSSFTLSFKTNNSLNSGTQNLIIESIDLYGNKGKITKQITISSIGNNIQIITNKNSLSPKESFTTNIKLLDQSNKEILKEQIEIDIENIYKDTIETGSILEKIIPEYTAPGNLKITASYKDITQEKIISILEQREITTKIEGSKVIVKNIGNIRYIDYIDLLLSGPDNYTIQKQIDLKPAEEKEFDLTKEDLNSSTYSLTVNNESSQIFIPELKQTKRLMVILIFLLIVAILIWLFWIKHNKKQTKGLFKIFQETNEKAKHHKKIAEESSKKTKKLEKGLVKSTLEKNKITGLFKKYLDPEVTKQIISTGKIMEGKKQQITAMFLDVRGFTSISEKMDPWAVRKTLNKYFDKVEKVVKRNQGSINKYIGDAVFIIFNAPKEILDHQRAAIISALSIQKQIKILNEKLMTTGAPPINIGIGINSGEAVVGGFGAGRRLEYTAIGDTVNVASRLEGLAHKGQILITEEIYNKYSDIFEGDYLGKFKVKNREQALRVYNIIGYRK